MPAPWLLLLTASPIAIQVQAAKPTILRLPGEVKITYSAGSYDLRTQKGSFDSGVVLEYEVSVVRADHLDVDTKNKVGSASGHVHLDDPVATLDAVNLEVWWGQDSHRGHAEDAFIQIGSSRLRAKSVDISPELWVLHDVEVTTSRANPPWYEVHSPTLSVKPGQNGKLVKPTLYILGHRIVTLPDRTFNLDRRSEGLTLPGFNYDRQYGLGASWGGGFLLNHETDLAFSAGIFPESRPGYGASVTRSLLPDSKPTTLITPPSDFGERFSFGYMENITVANPEGEQRYVRSPQQSVSVDSVWNQVLYDRDSSLPYSKAIEGVYEVGGQSGDMGYLAQARLQTIRQFADPFITRLVLIGDLLPQQLHVTPNLSGLFRIDTEAFAESSPYAWARGIAGLSYEPVKQARLSIAGYYSQDVGTPALPIDPLYSKVGYVVRGDLNFGPTKFSYLTKYDDSLKWFDREYSISQVVGCFEPYLVYRENPSDYQLGLRLRLDDLTDLLNKRNFARPTTPASARSTVISPALNGTP